MSVWFAGLEGVWVESETVHVLLCVCKTDKDSIAQDCQ